MNRRKNKKKKIKPAKRLKKKIIKKAVKNKKRKSVVLLRKNLKKRKSTSIKKNKKAKTKKIKSRKKGATLLSLGDIHPSRVRILTLIVSIIFMATGMIFTNVFRTISDSSGKVAGASIEAKKESKLERGIKNMVKGYPIEKMTPYIAKKDPKTAAFLVAIAKKESNWGKRRPVLNGQDCYNYWGFRLKAERMGSGGHTCFDSPKEAVNIVADRIDEMVKEENIGSPEGMVVWKCGYGCQDEEKSSSEKKWIKDVAYYYNELERYL